jgi:hypothetical protein
MKKIIMLLIISMVSACANINTLEDLRTNEPVSPRYESDLPLSELDVNVKKYIYSCYKYKGSTVKMNGASLGGTYLSIDRHVNTAGIDYVIKRMVRGGYNHWILVSLRGDAENKSSGIVFIDDLLPSYVFNKFEKVIKNQEVDCPTY